MYNFGMFGLGGFFPAWFPAFMFLVVIWSLFWKGLAMWHASRRKQPYWFVILLVVNTMGILELVYLFVVLKIKINDLFNKNH